MADKMHLAQLLYDKAHQALSMLNEAGQAG